MNCPKCNKKLPDGARFCTGCGTPIEEKKDSSKTNDEKNDAIAKQETEKKHSVEKKKLSPVLFVVIVAIILVGVYQLGKVYINHMSDEYNSELGDVYRMLTDTNSNNDKEAERLFKKIGEPPKYYSDETKEFYASIVGLFTENYKNNPQLHEDILDGIYRIFDGPTNPTEYEIIDQLSKVEGITGIEAVTENNDINGMMNQPGGYTSDIFFSHKGAKKAYSKKNNLTVAEVGTTGGGSVEIYPTFNDAVRRCNYLDLIRMSTKGQKEAIVGTSVIRVSEYLSSKEQDKLIEDIASVLRIKKESDNDKDASSDSEKKTKAEKIAENKKNQDQKASEIKAETKQDAEDYDDTEVQVNGDQYYTQGCRLVKQGDYYYLFPIYVGEEIICEKTHGYKNFPMGKGLKIASNAKVGIAISAKSTETVYGTEELTYEYKYDKFYNVVDELFYSKHWQTIDIGNGPDTFAFEVNGGGAIMNLLLLNFNDDGEIIQLMDYYAP